MKMKKIFIIVLVLFIFCVTKIDAKTLPQSKAAKTKVTKQTVTGISVTPKLRKDRKALFIYFNNLQNSTNVSYTLIYKTEGREEGAGGSVRKDEGNSTSRELLFGTCSKTVCRYHTNITDMRLEVTTMLKSGKTSLKRYKIKV